MCRTWARTQRPKAYETNFHHLFPIVPIIDGAQTPVVWVRRWLRWRRILFNPCRKLRTGGFGRFVGCSQWKRWAKTTSNDAEMGTTIERASADSRSIRIVPISLDKVEWPISIGAKWRRRLAPMYLIQNFHMKSSKFQNESEFRTVILGKTLSCGPNAPTLCPKESVSVSWPPFLYSPPSSRRASAAMRVAPLIGALQTWTWARDARGNLVLGRQPGSVHRASSPAQPLVLQTRALSSQTVFGTKDCHARIAQVRDTFDATYESTILVPLPKSLPQPYSSQVSGSRRAFDCLHNLPSPTAQPCVVKNPMGPNFWFSSRS